MQYQGHLQIFLSILALLFDFLTVATSVENFLFKLLYFSFFHFEKVLY